jgi:26S proteasome non-ATPase regulatory subunit 10
LLIRHKADVNSITNQRRTPLHYSAQRGHVPITQLLLQHKSHVNIIERAARETPLHRAAATGNSQIVELLLEAKADIHALDHHRRTALHKATISGDVGTIDLLISRGAALWFRDKFGKTARDCATSTACRLAFDRATSTKSRNFFIFFQNFKNLKN